MIANRDLLYDCRFRNLKLHINRPQIHESSYERDTYIRMYIRRTSAFKIQLSEEVNNIQGMCRNENLLTNC